MVKSTDMRERDQVAHYTMKRLALLLALLAAPTFGGLIPSIDTSPEGASS